MNSETNNSVAHAIPEARLDHCYYCDSRGGVGGVCDSPRCQAYDREVTEERDRAATVELKSAVRAAIRQRGKEGWENAGMSRIKRWFYTAKAISCVLLGWTTRPARTEAFPDVVEVGYHHYERLYAGWEASWLQVGRGVFRQWWAEIESDSDWWM